MSEFLREQQCDGEIDQQENGEHEAGCRNPIAVHGLPQFLACLDVEKRHDEESHGEQKHHCILHSRSPVVRGPALVPAQGWRVGSQTRLGPNQPAQLEVILLFRESEIRKEFVKNP
jgi:hypothetical protein